MYHATTHSWTKKINYFILTNANLQNGVLSTFHTHLHLSHVCIFRVFASQWFTPSFPSVTFTANWKKKRKEGFSPLRLGLLGNPSPAWNEMDRGRETQRGTRTCTLEERGTRTVTAERDLLLNNITLKLIHKQEKKPYLGFLLLLNYWWFRM